MCDSECLKKDERVKILEILETFDFLKDIIDEIRETYTKKAYIGKITNFIADSNEFIYYGGPPKYRQINTSKSGDNILYNFSSPERVYSSHYNYWLKCKLIGEEMPNMIKAHCLCFHCIKALCFIKNIKTGKIYTIGIECIKKFTNNNRQCEKCYAKHRNSKDNFCKKCRVEKAKLLKLKENLKKEILENVNMRVEIKRKKEYIIENNKRLEKLKEFEKEENKRLKQLKKERLENKLVNFGKYAEKTIKYLFDNDKKYVMWCYKQNQNQYSSNFIDIINYIGIIKEERAL